MAHECGEQRRSQILSPTAPGAKAKTQDTLGPSSTETSQARRHRMELTFLAI